MEPSITFHAFVEGWRSTILKFNLWFDNGDMYYGYKEADQFYPFIHITFYISIYIFIPNKFCGKPAKFQPSGEELRISVRFYETDSRPID